MEYTIEEIQAMLNIVSAVINNSRFEKYSMLRTSKVYNIDDFDIKTMQKWIEYWQKTINEEKSK